MVMMGTGFRLQGRFSAHHPDDVADKLAGAVTNHLLQQPASNDEARAFAEKNADLIEARARDVRDDAALREAIIQATLVIASTPWKEGSTHESYDRRPLDQLCEIWMLDPAILSEPEPMDFVTMASEYLVASEARRRKP